MIYQVAFDQFKLDYEIIDSPVSRIWSKLVLRAQDNGCEISKNRWITASLFSKEKLLKSTKL